MIGTQEFGRQDKARRKAQLNRDHRTSVILYGKYCTFHVWSWGWRRHDGPWTATSPNYIL